MNFDTATLKALTDIGVIGMVAIMFISLRPIFTLFAKVLEKKLLGDSGRIMDYDDNGSPITLKTIYLNQKMLFNEHVSDMGDVILEKLDAMHETLKDTKSIGEKIWDKVNNNGK